DEDDDDGIEPEFSSPYFTQPTQVVGRKTLGGNKVNDSSPPSKIEVPRSSPFKSSPVQQQRARPSILGMFPSGTLYRPPQNAFTKTVTKKPDGTTIEIRSDGIRLHSSPKHRARSDSSASDQSDGADIKPTSFQREVLTSPSKNDSRITKAAQQAADFEKNYDGDMAAAEKTLLGGGGLERPSPSPKRSSASLSASPVPGPKRRRLVRGRNPANATNSSQPSAAPLISLVDSESDNDNASISSIKDDGDNYQSGSDEESEEDEDHGQQKAQSTKQQDIEQPRVGMKRAAKIMQYLESCTVDQLAADAKISKDNAKFFISKRPFHSINQVRTVYHFKTVRKRKEKVELGEDVFHELNQHIKRLNAIDRVVEQCETQGTIIRSKIEGWKMDRFGKLDDSVKSPTEPGVLPFPKEPMLVTGKLFPHQLYGMNWMWQLYSRGFGGILADDMGTGKTFQVISFLALLHDVHESGLLQNKPGPNLVVVPPTLVDNWQQEFAKFAPELSVIVYSGPPEERDELARDILESSEDCHVILTSFSQMSRTRDAIWMDKIGINAAFFDEGHRLKNAKTKTYSDLIRIRANWKILITGTPIQNNIMEMMTLLNFISPQLFHRDRECIEELFMQKASLKEVSEGATLLSDRIQRARSILEPFILVRKKDKVSALPPKTRRVIYCDMPDVQKKVYDDLVNDFRLAKDQKSTADKRKNDENNPWIQLRKAATHPQLFRRFFSDKKCEKMAKILMEKAPSRVDQQNLLHMENELKSYSDFELHLWCRDFKCVQDFDCPQGSWYESGKLRKLLELVNEFQQNGDRVLVFSPFTKSLGIIEECLSESGIAYRLLVGSTTVADRQDLVDEFQGDETIPVFLLTTMAGGVGLNLTGANKIIIFDQSDNPQLDIQAENRVHRLGQKRDVEVIRLITKGTIDELIYKACKVKLELANQITGDGEDMEKSNDMEAGENIVANVTEAIMKG
ncbi:hypothetical protein M406DRAFT_236094, partial [Cryphonectria parasitica EP155]